MPKTLDLSPRNSAFQEWFIRVGLIFLSLFILQAQDGCPLGLQGNENNTQTPSGVSVLDVGGEDGAKWHFTYDDEISVALHDNGKVSSEKVSLSEGILSLMGNTLDLGLFCWRQDVVCPHQILPSETTIYQLSNYPQTFFLNYYRRGPLQALPTNQPLSGQLDGGEMIVTLEEIGTDFCILQSGSSILGTAFDRSGESKTADIIRGQSTVVYSGLCADTGGSGALPLEALLVLTMGFSAERVF